MNGLEYTMGDELEGKSQLEVMSYMQNHDGPYEFQT